MTDSSTAHAKPREVILMVADISGYTHFMVSNRDTLGHAHVVISELIKTIIREIRIPLQVSKLEGDAVFLYAMKAGGGMPWEERKKRIRGKLFSFFKAFRARALELQHSGACACGACANADRLRLKAVVHSGSAIRAKLGRYEELTGVDVIVLHRLLKNSLKSHEYILFTEGAYRDLGYLPGELAVVDGTEHYDDVGDVKVKVNYPYGAPPDEAADTAPLPIDEADRKRYSSRFYRIKNMIPKMITMYALKWGLRKEPEYRNLPKID
ncbi:MAG: DUF2652 domain-containing protein [Candidatus Coatesbacteria bacterium]